MAKPLELTISTKYVPKWGVWEGVREIMQNALDARDLSDASFDVRYDPNYANLIIENKGVVLERQTLLLGESGKTGNSAARGQFGEGYKLAWLALLRAGLTIRIDTGEERWVPVLMKSEQFGGAEVIGVEIKKRTLKDGFYNGVKVVIGPLSKGDWQRVKERVLDLTPPKETIPCGYYGQILCDETHRGLLFSKGLFVTNLGTGYNYGYDLHRIELDRDRKMAEPWSLRYNIRQALDAAVRDEKLPDTQVYGLLNTDGGEAEAVRDAVGGMSTGFAEKMAHVFKALHGEKAIPVASTGESLEAENLGARGVVVHTAIRSVLGQALETLEKRKETADSDVVYRYGVSELSSEEMANLIHCAHLLSAHGGLKEFSLGQVTVVEFRGDTFIGRYGRAEEGGQIMVAKWTLSDPAELLATLAHEACHHESKDAPDGSVAHRNLVEKTLAQIALRALAH